VRGDKSSEWRRAGFVNCRDKFGRGGLQASEGRLYFLWVGNELKDFQFSKVIMMLAQLSLFFKAQLAQKDSKSSWRDFSCSCLGA